MFGIFGNRMLRTTNNQHEDRGEQVVPVINDRLFQRNVRVLGDQSVRVVNNHIVVLRERANTNNLRVVPQRDRNNNFCEVTESRRIDESNNQVVPDIDNNSSNLKLSNRNHNTGEQIVPNVNNMPTKSRRSDDSSNQVVPQMDITTRRKRHRNTDDQVVPIFDGSKKTKTSDDQVVPEIDVNLLQLMKIFSERRNRCTSTFH